MRPGVAFSLCFAFLVLGFWPVDGIIILEPPGLKNAVGSIASPPLPQFVLNFTTIEAVRLILPKDLPSKPTNSCVFFTPSPGISPDLGIKNVWRQGAQCVVAVSFLGPGGTGKYFRDRADDVSLVRIPVVEIEDTYAPLILAFLNNGTEIVITVNSTDPNLNDQVIDGPVGIAGVVIISSLAIINLILSIWKIQAHVRVYGCKPTIAQAVIWIDIAANILRIWFGLVNMAFRNGILYLFTTITASLSWPLNIITLLLVSVKWHEITQKSQMQSSLFLGVNRKPFLLISLFLFLLELIASMLRGLYFSVTLLTAISWTVLLIATIIVVIMLWVFGARVLRWISKVRSSGAVEDDENIKSMRRVTIGLMSAGGAMFFVAIVFIVTFLVAVVGNNNTGSVVLTILVLTGLNIASMIQMLSFPTPTMENKRQLANKAITSSSSKSMSSSKS